MNRRAQSITDPRFPNGAILMALGAVVTRLTPDGWMHRRARNRIRIVQVQINERGGHHA
jgi:hypothetical protein